MVIPIRWMRGSYDFDWQKAEDFGVLERQE